MTNDIENEKMFLTEDEQKLINLLGVCHELFGIITGNGITRRADMAEVTSHIHVLQHRVMAQAAARLYPHHLRLLGEVCIPQEEDEEKKN